MNKPDQPRLVLPRHLMPEGETRALHAELIGTGRAMGLGRTTP